MTDAPCYCENCVAISDTELGKLAKVLELLRSSFDGERLSAGEHACNLLGCNQITWTQLMQHVIFLRATLRNRDGAIRELAAEIGALRRQSAPSGPAQSWRERAANLLRHPNVSRLSEKQTDFLQTVAAARTWQLTAKQETWLAGLETKLESQEPTENAA